jgi:hypothetical protein
MTILRQLQGHRGKSLLAAGILASILFAATSSSASSKFPDNFAPAHSGLSDHLALPSHTIPTGSSETGFLIVNNRTKTTINLTKECQPEIEGLLRGSRYAQPNSSDLVCSSKSLLIKPGLNRLPVRFEATYLSCSQDSNGASGMVRCLNGNREPSLPLGNYEAHVDGGGARLPVPRAIALHLTAR